MKTFFRIAMLLALFAFIAGVQAATRLPNIVIIFADDMGYGDIGVYGAKGYKTPNLDRLAREGTKFNNFHVAQPVCSASRAALLTGCYPNRIGINGALGPSARHGLNSSETTLAEMLKAKGYATGMSGKWHLGHHPEFLPTRHGFDEYFGLPYSNDMWPHHPEAKKGTYPELPLIEGDKAVQVGLDGKDQEQLTTQYTERAVRFIDRNRGKPFFFYLAHSMPHVPLYVSEKFKGKSGAGLYGDVMMEIDWSVGEVMAALKRNGLEKNTLIIFTSDNGPWLSYGEHSGSSGNLREGKGTCWEGGTRVPCLMKWPGKIPSGKENDAMFMTIDLLPTIANLVDATLPAKTIDGRDVWPLMIGKRLAKNPHDAYFFYYERNELQAVTSGDGRWKLQLPHTYRTLPDGPKAKGGIPVRYASAKIVQPELYDLSADVSETRNVAADHLEVVKSLLAHADKARADLGDVLTKQTGTGVREPGQLPAQSN